jgi:hypothetical protein
LPVLEVGRPRRRALEAAKPVDRTWRTKATARLKCGAARSRSRRHGLATARLKCRCVRESRLTTVRSRAAEREECGAGEVK